MSRTYRNIKYAYFIRRPRHKWKLLAGYPVHSRKVVTDWDDKNVAGMREMKHHVHPH